MDHVQRPSKLAKFLWCGVVAVLVLVPFHAVFTTWAGSNFGYIDVFRIWKELLLVVLATVAAWLIYQDPELRRRLLDNRLVQLILAYMALHVLLGFWALGQGAVNDTALIYALLINLRLIAFMLVAMVAAYTAVLAHSWQSILLWPAAVVVAFGLLQQFVLPADFLSHLGYGPDTIPAVQTVDQKLEYRRIQSTLRGANPLGAYLVVVITALAALWVAKRRPDRKWLGAFGLAAATVLFFTYSRSAWIGILLSLGFLGFWSIRQTRLRKLLVIFAAATALVLAGTIWLLRDNDRLQNTLFHSDETSQSAESSNAGRLRQLEAGGRDVLHEPLGRGPGTAGPASVRNDGQGRIAENYYVQLAQETGLPGLGLFLAINALVAIALWRRRQDTLALILLASLIGITIINLLSHAWTDDTLAYVWWGLAGMALAPVILKDKHGKTASKTDKRA